LQITWVQSGNSVIHYCYSVSGVEWYWSRPNSSPVGGNVILPLPVPVSTKGEWKCTGCGKQDSKCKPVIFPFPQTLGLRI
jgi:hypothetical protein